MRGGVPRQRAIVSPERGRDLTPSSRGNVCASGTLQMKKGGHAGSVRGGLCEFCFTSHFYSGSRGASMWSPWKRKAPFSQRTKAGESQ